MGHNPVSVSSIIINKKTHRLYFFAIWPSIAMKSSTASYTSSASKLCIMREEKKGMGGSKGKVSKMGFCDLAMTCILTGWFEITRLVSFN